MSSCRVLSARHSPHFHFYSHRSHYTCLFFLPHALPTPTPLPTAIAHSHHPPQHVRHASPGHQPPAPMADALPVARSAPAPEVRQFKPDLAGWLSCSATVQRPRWKAQRRQRTVRSVCPPHHLAHRLHGDSAAAGRAQGTTRDAAQTLRARGRPSCAAAAAGKRMGTHRPLARPTRGRRPAAARRRAGCQPPWRRGVKG